MGKKMKLLPFLSKINATDSSKALWPWPAYCQRPRTLSFSFRTRDGMFKTINSAYLDASNIDVVDTPESWFTNSCESASFSTASDMSGGEAFETVIKGLRSERLFFEPGETSSILEEAKAGSGGDEFPFKESVVLSMESQDPYLDFKKSMEEMVEAHGLTDWEGLEELLCCYLKVNGKSNHGYIIGAFVDLLVGRLAFNSSIAIASTTTTTATHNHDSCSCSHDSPSSPLSFYTSSTSSDDSSSTPCCASSFETGVEIDCLTSLEADNGVTKNQ